MNNLFSEELEKELIDQEDDHDTCIICYLSEPKKYLFCIEDCNNISNESNEFKCIHKFHISCLKTDIQFNFKRSKNYTCPYCNKDFNRKKVLKYVDDLLQTKSLRGISHYKLLDLQKIAEECNISLKMEKKTGGGLKNKPKRILYKEILEFKEKK
jgi:hypothetical protein